MIAAWLRLEEQAPGTGTLDELVFARTELWPLFFLVPLLVGAYLWAAHRRKQSILALGRPDLVARLVATVSRRNRTVSAASVVGAVAFMVAAALRPQYGGTAEIVPASGVDVVLAVDYSKSMLAKDVYPSRSERLEAELARFLEEADARGDRVGLVVFAGEARGLPVTRDTRLLQMYLERADPRTENPGGTAIGKALSLGLTFLVDARKADAEANEGDVAEGEQLILLLTDGEDTASRPVEVAEQAARLGVRIYTVGIGSTSGEPIAEFDAQGNRTGYVTDENGNYVMTRLDQDLLEQLAEATSGEYIHVQPDSFGLDAVRDTLAELSVGAREDTIEIHREEGFAFLLWPALGLLCVSIGLGERRRRRGR